jgi:hypothetical protein
MGIVVKRPVRLKVIVTEGFKVRRAAEMRAALAKLDAVGKGLEARLASGPQADAAMTERLRAGLRKNERARAALLKELENVTALEIGAEYERGVLEGSVEVEVGDHVSRLGCCEIVIKDDKVVEIREGHAPR